MSLWYVNKFFVISLLLLLFLSFTGNSIKAQTLAGDTNSDGKVDIIDIGIIIDNYGRTTLLNPKADINGDRRVDIIDIGIVIDNYGRSGGSGTSTPAPTNPPVSGGNKWGIFPNCIAPAMPVEAQTWWLEKENPKPGDNTSRHIHAAACIPNARDTAGRLVTVNGVLEFTRVILIHNSNIQITKGDNGFPETGGSGVEFPVRFSPALTCANRANCVFYSTNKINTGVAPDGLHELRWRVQGTHPDLANDSEFISFATKIFIKNGGSVNSSANNPAPRARGWYEGFEYDTSEITNYTDLYNGRTDISVPIVKGSVNLQMNHTQSVGGTIKSRLYLDPDFHNGSSGTVLYDKPGLFRGGYTLDTTRIPNGRHALVMETEHTESSGVHSGLLKVFIEVNN
jgi:hypothetical protein